jgi:hypothetical protein
MHEKVLDHQKLYLRVLDTLRPELAETIRLESEVAGGPVEIVVLGGVGSDHPVARQYVGEQTLGRIVISGEADSGAMFAAGVIVDELDELYERSLQGEKVLKPGMLFRELLGEISPHMVEVFDLEVALAGEEVELNFDDDAETSLGTLNLVGEDSDQVKVAAALASRLFELYQDALTDVAESSRWRKLRGRLRRRRS